MILLKGMGLNVEKSSDGTNGNRWSLYFDRGHFITQSGTMFRSTEPYVLKLKKSDYICQFPCGYHLYYNPENNKFSIITDQEHRDLEKCNDYGYHIGGFMIKDCKLNFVYPKNCDEIEFIRDFTSEFDSAYNKLRVDCDTPEEVLEEICGTFNELNFNEDYDIDCIVYETSENEFNICEFNPEEFEADGEDEHCETNP
jgi:hypothetical protein